MQAVAQNPKSKEEREEEKHEKQRQTSLNEFFQTSAGVGAGAGAVVSWDSPSGGGETCNVEALTADKTLTATDAPIQMYTCTANRIVNLPTTGLIVGQKFEFWNRNSYSSIASIAIKQSTTTIDTIYTQKSTIVRWTGTAWEMINAVENTTIGRAAKGIGGGAACGDGANADTDGMAVGRYANGMQQGAAAGRSSDGQFYGAAFGYLARTNSKQSETIAMGAYSKAERNREFVSTATANQTNKAQLSIQKFMEKNLATAAAAWQELFIDGSSARLSIIASSVYNFRAQINAIDVTTLDVKTWEIIGTIKRNAANATSMVGTPTVTVIAADTAAANWDARITADDTNESLKVEVKHDSANNVRFSLNIIATETRV
jgi:hypothetical protein